MPDRIAMNIVAAFLGIDPELVFDAVFLYENNDAAFDESEGWTDREYVAWRAAQY